MIWIIASCSWMNLLNLDVIMNYRAGQQAPQPLNRIWVRETESIQSLSLFQRNQTPIKSKIAPLRVANIGGGKTSI